MTTLFLIRLLGPVGKAAVLVLVGGCAFVASAYGRAVFPAIWFEWPSQSAVVEESREAEIVLVYIGSSTCAPSNSQEARTLVAAARHSVEAQAGKLGVRLRTIGVAKDASVGAGLAHLSRLKPFDEIATGRGWLNLGILRYIRSEFVGAAATPQVVVTFRNLSHVDGGSSLIRGEHVLARKVGLEELRGWATTGFQVTVPRGGN